MYLMKESNHFADLLGSKVASTTFDFVHSSKLISEFYNHAQNDRVQPQSEAQLLWRATHSCKHGGLYGRSECRWGKKAGNSVFAALYCARFRTPSFHKSLKFFETSIASLDPETVELPAFYILSAMFTGACGPPEKLSLTLVSRSNILGLIVKFAYTALAKLTYVLSVIQSKLCLRHLLYYRLMKGWSFLFSIDVSPALHCSL